MSEIRDNSNPEDYLFDSGSIKLTESEPLSSNSYIYIDLETDEGSRRSARNRPQQRGYYPQQAETEQAKQKKAKRKAAEAQSRVAVPPRVNRGPEPALHVIIEHETPYDDYDFEPEVPDPEPVSPNPSFPEYADPAMAPMPGSMPDPSHQHTAQAWQSQQPAQPVQQMQPQAYPAQQLQQQPQPVQPGYPIGSSQPIQPVVSQHGASAQSAQQPAAHQFVQQYMQESYPSVQPQAYQPVQQMQPMQPMQSPTIGAYVQPDIAFQGAQQPYPQSQQYVSKPEPTIAIDSASLNPSSPSAHQEAADKATESISADGKVVRRPWGAPASAAANPPSSAAADPLSQAAVPNAGAVNIDMRGNVPIYGAQAEASHAHRGMMSWKKSSPEAKDLNHAFGSATVPITMQSDTYPLIDRPEVRIAPQQSDAFAATDNTAPADKAAFVEKPKPKEKPLKINVGAHGKVSTQDHLTISRESIEQLSREQEAKASPIKTMSSRAGASSANSQRTVERRGDRQSAPVSSQPAPSPGNPRSSRPADKGDYIDSFGAPLLDEAALEESSMFEEPPTSIADGMKAADKHHKKHRKGIVVAVIFMLVAALAAVLALLHLTGQINLSSMIGNFLPQQSAIQQSSSSSTAVSGSSASSGKTDQSGTVIYEYTAATSSGVDYKVKETVTFSADGNCESTQMEYEFPSAADLDALLANLSRDYGSDYKLISQDGNKATVSINISNLKLDRESYEDALRYSVDDLMILKK